MATMSKRNVSVNISMPPNMARDLKQRAKERDLSVSQMVRRLIRLEIHGITKEK